MGLLGHVLARRAGMSYEALVTERILTPLGMTDTRIALTPEMRTRLASGHAADLEPAANWDLTVLAGAGAWRSTATDMLRFLGAAIQPPRTPLGRALEMAMQPRHETGTPGLQIGLGWHMLRQNGRLITWHNGQTGGYHAFLGYDSASAAGVVVLANSAISIDDIARHVLDPASPVQHPAPPRPAVAVDAAVLERYVGRYELAPQFVLDITREGDVLYLQATGQPRVRMFAASPTRFFLRVVEAEVEFTIDAAGAATGLVLFQGGRETPGRRLPGG
jgi:CubicO group peptidase (beta-lactamase class C family)